MATQAELTGARALSLLKPRLAEVSKATLANLKVDVMAAAIAAQGVSRRTLAPALRGRFEKLAGIGEFALGDLELLSMAGLAAAEARTQADKALAKGSNAKVPLEVIKEAAKVEHRMQIVAEHTLGGLDTAKPELSRLAAGSSYRDLAGDLEGYAALYDQHPADVAKDGVNYAAGDPALARSLSRKIYDALGDGLTQRDHGAIDTLARAWTFLLEIYERVALAGRFLEREKDPEGAFPSLYVAGLRGSGRPRKAAAPSPSAPPTPAAPTPAAPTTAAPAPAAFAPAAPPSAPPAATLAVAKRILPRARPGRRGR